MKAIYQITHEPTDLYTLKSNLIEADYYKFDKDGFAEFFNYGLFDVSSLYRMPDTCVGSYRKVLSVIPYPPQTFNVNKQKKETETITVTRMN